MAIDTDWIPPRIEDLNVFRKGDAYLCLNSAVPAWLVTTELGSTLLGLSDGRARIGQIADSFRSGGLEIDEALFVDFYREAAQAGLFVMPSPGDGTGNQQAWLSRRVATVHLHLTNRCNLSCSYCYRSSHPNIPLRTDVDSYLSLLEELKAIAAPECEITFAGGEPLVYPGFERVVEASSKLGFGTFLLTNGILLRKYSADFYRRNVDRMRISLDGGDEITHSATRGKGHFEKVIANIEWLVGEGMLPSVQMTLTKRNMETAAELRRRLPEAVLLRYTPMFPMGRADQERAAVSPEDFISPEDFHQFRLSLGIAGGRQDWTPGLRNTNCSAGKTNISIDDNGDVYPCHLFHEKRFKIGNVFEAPLREMLFGTELKTYVESMHVDANNPECARCAIRYLCGGGCKANALHGRGDYRARDSLCSYLRKETVEGLFASYGL